MLLLAALLVTLAAAAYWTYGYLEATETRKSQNATQPAASAATQAAPSADNTSPEKPPTPASQNAASAPAASAASQVSPSAISQGPAENSTAISEPSARTPDSDATPATRPTPATPPSTPKTALGEKTAEKREPAVPAPKPSKLSEAAAKDTGSEDFHRGEAYLYGRGAPENCNEAMKYLRAASAKSNAKARSTFGTMYATGHCVPRDLPTSYSWFAMALELDPNNQILQKDLSAVWNQMTPPERQLATRMKQ